MSGIGKPIQQTKTLEERVAFIELHLSNTIKQVDELSTQFNRLLKMLEDGDENDQRRH